MSVHAQERYRVNNFPDELRTLNRWILFAIEHANGRPVKVPYTPGTNRRARSNDASTWASFEAACDFADRQGRYLGFAFTPDLGITFVDIDDVVGAAGAVKDYAQLVVDTLDSYTEVSLNGGLHIFVRGRPPDGFTREKIGGKIEVYPQQGGRFCLITGDLRPGLGSIDGLIEERTTELAGLFPAREHRQPTPQEAPNGIAKLPDEAIDAIVAVLRRSWNDGQRHDMGVALGGILAKNSIPEAQAITMAERLSVGDAKPGDRIKAVKDSYRKAHAGLDIKGYHALREMIPKDALTIVDDILGRFWWEHRAKTPSEDGAAVDRIDEIRTTDLGNARRMVAFHGEDTRYCALQNAWYVWDGARWDRDETGAVERRAKDTVREIFKEAATMPQGDERKALWAHACRSEAAAKIRAMIELARSEPTIPITITDLDAGYWLIPFRNGTYDARTNELRPHARGDLLTKCIPYAFDEFAEAPRWTAFLEEVQPNPAIRQWIQQFFGYAMAGGGVEQIVAIAYGEGQNGKSTICNVLTKIIAPYVVQAEIETFLAKRQESGGSGATPDLARLKGARIVFAREPEKGRRLNVSRIKEISGGEKIVARELYGKPFEFDPHFSLWISANDKPRVPGEDKALFRRLKLIPFNVVIPEARRNNHLADELVRDEAEGILLWMIEGLRAWRAAGRLPIVEEIQEATREYQNESDDIGRFLDDCCEIGSGQVAFADLYKAYCAWVEQVGAESNSGKPLSKTAFGRDLGKRHFDDYRDRTAHYRLGLTLLVTGDRS